MRTRNNIFSIGLICLSSIFLNGCKGDNDKVFLVKKAFEYLNDNNTSGLLTLVNNPDQYAKRGNLTGYVWASDIIVQVDKKKPGHVYYSCTIPGAASVTVNNLLGANGIKYSVNVLKALSERFSKNLTLTGEIPIIIDPATKEMRMDITGPANPFSIYLGIITQNPGSINLNSGENTIQEISSALWRVGLVVGDAYSKINGDKNYLSNVLWTELNANSGNLNSYVPEAEKLADPEKLVKPNEKEANTVADNNTVTNNNSKTEFFDNHGISDLKLWATIIGIIIIGILLFIKAFSASWNSKNEKKRLRAVEKITDENKLHKIVRETKYSDVRVAVIKKITNKAVLEEIALKFSDSNARKEAVKKITDEEVLKKVILKDSNRDVCIAAIKKITDETVLRDIALNSTDWQVRLAAVEKITDEAILKEIALKDNHNDICNKAVEKITNEKFINEIALKAYNSKARIDVVEKVTDETVLRDIALNNTDWQVRMPAVKKITDETILKEIALKDDDRDVCHEAIGKITNEKYINEIALNAKNSNARIDAVKKVTDEAILKEAVLKDSDSNVCLWAIENISDETFLKKTALENSHSQVRLAAVRAIKNETVLKEVALKDKDSNVCQEAIGKIKNEKSFNEIALKALNSEARKNAARKVTDETTLEELVSQTKDGEIYKLTLDKLTQKKQRLLLSDHIQIFLSPKEATTLGGTRKHYLSYEFSNHTKTDKEEWGKTAVVFGNDTGEKINSYEITKSGWSLAALGRLLTKDCTPEQFKESLVSFDNKVIPAYNKDYEQIAELQKKYAEINDIESTIRLRQMGMELPSSRYLKDIDLDGKRKQLIKDFNALQNRLAPVIANIEKGILSYADKADVLPFGFFLQVINDSQGRFDRFIRQGAIMGMIDFFMKYKDNEIIKPHFENLIAARADMISSDHQMSFFEVRTPKNCTAKEYAAILKEVLHCANPTINFCDTERLMEIAEQEIPGVMDLLVNFPLRLIDPGNKATEGFYTFEPYRHAMWVRYTPPMNAGQVQKRYHEVLDMTLPNSSGLNIRLFTDPYASVPVMFHEYNHYMEDPNEASVFLKTYAFSQKFYRKYKDAEPAKDYAFIQLNQLLGKDVDPDKFNELNNLILKYYGAPKSKSEAEAEADADLQQKNLYIQFSNQQETWCPDVKMPLLNDEGDKYNADLIREIRIRYAQVPRTVTKTEYSNLWTNFMLLNDSQYKSYQKLVPEMFSKIESEYRDGKSIKRYSQWESFKDWCVGQKYIKEYK